MKIKLKPFQEIYICCKKRFPAFVGGWGTGKSLAGILRGMDLSEKYPGNLGVIYRHEYRDLEDSTIRDFEQYTGLKATGKPKEVKLKNGSQILFRHLEDLDSIQNLNLGWFWIEQAEELDTEEIWHKLKSGRLRRKIGGEEIFTSGFITANTKGSNWIKKLWKDSPGKDYMLVEATTWENEDNLPKDFIEDKRQLEKVQPAIYRRFVLNSWADEDIADFIIQMVWIEQSVLNTPVYTADRVLITCDPARYGDDETVIYILKNTMILDQQILHGKSTMEIAGRLGILEKEHQAGLVVIDEIGLGAGTVDRAKELCDCDVRGVNSASQENFTEEDKKKYLNLRAKMWWEVSKLFENEKVRIFRDADLINQLGSVKYSFRNGKIKVEDKDEIKKRLGRSPDRADALVQGLFYLDMCKYQNEYVYDNDGQFQYEHRHTGY